MVKFILGEDKYVKIRLHSPNGEKFIIDGASYELSLYGEEEISGDAIIEGEYISAKINPKRTGHYVLEFTYHIADTTRKCRIKLEVI